MEYKQIAIPKVLADRFRDIQPVLGYRTFSEYVVGVIRQRIRLDEIAAEALLAKLAEKSTELQEVYET